MPAMPLRIVIAAMSASRVIGSGEGMPWHVPEEYQHFLRTVAGQTMIMGRRSWEIFGADVSTAHNLVISRSATIPGVEIMPSLEAALDHAASYGLTIFIAGGASVYRQALDADVVDAMYLSTIKGDFSGDAFFPAFDAARWRVVETRDEGPYVFTHWQRVR